MDIIKRIKELNGLELTDTDKVWLRNVGESRGVPYLKREGCKDCWNDYMLQIYNLLNEEKNRNAKNKKTETPKKHKLINKGLNIRFYGTNIILNEITADDVFDAIREDLRGLYYEY